MDLVKFKNVEKAYVMAEKELRAFCESLESDNVDYFGDIQNEKIVFYVSIKLLGRMSRTIVIGADEGVEFMARNYNSLSLSTQLMVEDEILKSFKKIAENKEHFLKMCALRREFITLELALKRAS